MCNETNPGVTAPGGIACTEAIENERRIHLSSGILPTRSRSMRIHHTLAALLGVAVLVIIAGRPAAQDKESKSAPKGGAANQQHYWDCAKACDDCARMCDACGAHCAKLIADGHKHHMATLRTCLDCADICRAAGAVTARTGVFSDLICQACADACKRCGDTCLEHGADDPIMKKCAEECKRCEQACREMLKHTGRGAERK